MDTSDPSLSDQFLTALNSFYQNEVVDLVDQQIQVFHSFTYGEMTIATLLFVGICLFLLKWIYEVIR